MGSEFCAGFYDTHGHWNNGFYCPRWSAPHLQYCCGTPSDRHCCQPASANSTTLSLSHDQESADESTLLPQVVWLTAAIALMLVLSVLTTSYYTRCCSYRSCKDGGQVACVISYRPAQVLSSLEVIAEMQAMLHGPPPPYCKQDTELLGAASDGREGVHLSADRHPLSQETYTSTLATDTLRLSSASDTYVISNLNVPPMDSCQLQTPICYNQPGSAFLEQQNCSLNNA